MLLALTSGRMGSSIEISQVFKNCNEIKKGENTLKNEQMFKDIWILV